jgi:serine/threonine protein kinase
MNALVPSGHAPSSAPASANSRLTAALEEYRALLEAGQRPDRAAFLAAHPDAGPKLADCLGGLEFVWAAAGNLSAPAGSVAAHLHDPVADRATLGDFRILREIGRGGMGIVYEAEQLSLGRRVALKVLPFAATMDPRYLQRFQNEARAAACLDHPHIVKVHAVGCERAVHFFAMQFIDGQTLEALIRSLQPAGIAQEAGAAPAPAPHAATTQQRGATVRSDLGREHFERVAQWGIQAAEALEHAHSLGIVHRDVKPANLLIDAHGKLWVTDFGLARTATDAGLTMTGDLIGTLRYMSPEQALAKHGLVDHRADIYSLGATMYELLTLQPAVAGTDREEILKHIAFAEPPPPRALNPAIPVDLETIVLKTLAKEPAERYASAGEFTDDLRRYLEHKPVRAKRPRIRQVLAKWARRNRALVAAGCIALLATTSALGGAVGWIVHDRQVRDEQAAKLANLLARYMVVDTRGRAKEKMDLLEKAFVPFATSSSIAPTSLVGTWHHCDYRNNVRVGDYDIELRENRELVMVRAQACDEHGRPTKHTALSPTGRWYLFSDVLVLNWQSDANPDAWMDLLILERVGDGWAYRGANPRNSPCVLRGLKKN